VYRNHDPKKSGHIAIIRPSTKSDGEIGSEGPEVTQAGGTNHNSCSLKEGFRNHRAGYENGEIRFFAHAVEKFEVQSPKLETKAGERAAK
jgi:hypothetical protein